MLLPEAFATASIAGLRLPRHRQSGALLYRVYTCLTLGLLLSMIVSQLMAFIFLTRSVDDVAEASFLFFTTINCSVKGVNMLLRRQRIDDLLDLFADRKCLPSNGEEFKICLYYDKIARLLALTIIGLGVASAGCLGIGPLLWRGDDYVLSMRAWQPYEITSEFRYYVTQMHQMISMATMVVYNCSTDLMCPGFMIQICAQLQIMYRRLRYLPDDTARQKQLVKESVQHHLLIFEMTEQLGTAFMPAIVSQYLLSIFTFCITVYELTTNPSDFVQVAAMIVYLGAMAVELLMYCWFGNEMYVTSQQFSEMISQANWTNKLDVSNRRSLLIMMIRSTLPIRITCGPFITLSTDSYTSILKMSYSVFNVLQRTH